MIGLQYLMGIGIFFFIGGLNAMLIRVELLRPTTPTFSPGQYLTLVGLHGSMMIMMVSSIILGPFGHYFVPLMIGSRRMAFPRLEALSFWLLPLAGVVLMTTIVYGGFPTGWTGYPTLGDQADAGMDGYLFAFALVGIGMILNALNMLVTVFNHRAPGMTWSRLPIFVWSMLTTSVLMLLGPPMLLAAVLMQVLDRTAATSFFIVAHRRQPVPVGEPVLVLRPPRGVHPRPARVRRRARDPAGVRAQAAVGPAPRSRGCWASRCSRSWCGSTTCS